MTQTNDLFKKSVQILNDNNINYWICHGTLLGIIRNKSLLTWDNDIDFAVWEDEYSKEDILKIFSINKGFRKEISLEEINSLHFETMGKRVDINFYTRDKDKAFIKWAVLTDEYYNKFYLVKILYQFVISFLVNNVTIKKAVKSQKGKIFTIIKSLIIIPLAILRKMLSTTTKKKLLEKSYKKYDIIGYSYPIHLMKFKEIEFMGMDISIPEKPEDVLKFTYGEDWKIPKKNYVWFKEGRNLYRQRKNIKNIK